MRSSLLSVEVPQILRVPREEFVTQRWHYEPGEHVTLLAPTGNGKTTLAYELLNVTASDAEVMRGSVSASGASDAAASVAFTSSRDTQISCVGSMRTRAMSPRYSTTATGVP